MKDKIVVGIIGCGFVGGALKVWLEGNNPDVVLRISDPPKGYTDDLSDIDERTYIEDFRKQTMVFTGAQELLTRIFVGKCFPKDVNAFAKLTAGTPLGTLLAPLHELNVHFRGVEEHI